MGTSKCGVGCVPAPASVALLRVTRSSQALKGAGQSDPASSFRCAALYCSRQFCSALCMPPPPRRLPAHLGGRGAQQTRMQLPAPRLQSSPCFPTPSPHARPRPAARCTAQPRGHPLSTGCLLRAALLRRGGGASCMIIHPVATRPVAAAVVGGGWALSLVVRAGCGGTCVSVCDVTGSAVVRCPPLSPAAYTADIGTAHSSM